MGGDPVGRGAELRQVVGVLDAVRAGGDGRVVELRGEAGIGKSTLFASVLAGARDRGWRVWSASPTEAEASFPWTGLAQLLADVRRADLDGLVESHVTQLEATTSPHRSAPIEPELVAFGLAALLDTARGDATPLLVAIDDFHWLDHATAGALAYALRGTPTRRCVVLLSARSTERVPFEPDRLVDAAHHTTLDLAGLSIASLRTIIDDATGHSLGRADLAQIHQRTGGNPLYSVELARAVLDGLSLDSAALPPSLRDTIGRRIAALPAPTRAVLGAAALSVTPTLTRLGSAFPDVDVVDTLAPAEAEGLVRLHQRPGADTEVVFRHPLMAAASIDALTTSERRTVHTGLADTAADLVERARHLIAAAGATTDVADQLDEAAREATARGALDTAVEIAVAAVDATAADAPALTRVERHLTVAQLAYDAGYSAQLVAAVDAATELLTATPEPVDAEAHAAWHDARERLAVLNTLVNVYDDDVRLGVAKAEQALALVRDPARRFRLHTVAMRLTQHADVRLGADVAERYFGEGTEHTGLFAALGHAELVMARAAVGDPVDLDAALALADQLDPADRPVYLSRLTEPVVWTDHPRALEVLELSVAHLEREGRRAARLQDLAQLVVHRFVRGEWAEASAGFDVLEEFSHENVQRDSTRAELAVLRAAQGNVEAARRLISIVSPRLADLTSNPTETLWVLTRVAIAHHTLGDPEAADRLLEAEALAEQLGVHAVRGLACRRDLVEALVAAGRLDEAEAALARLVADAERNQVPTAAADANAATGVLAAARGDHERARQAFAEAIEVHRRAGLGYELARTLLAAGSAARRAGSRGEARELLGEARERFVGMGAATWVARCDDELERVRGRRAGSESSELTPTERQIAEHVAAGHTNAEIAAAMFVSVRTVESNLTKVYRKLGVRSRTELTRRLAEQAI